MEKYKIGKYICYAVPIDLDVEVVISMLETNGMAEHLIYLDERSHKDLYTWARKVMQQKQTIGVSFDFDYDHEPLIFNKYVNGKMSGEYRICIFEKSENKYKGKLSDIYCNGMPLFYDTEGNLIKPSLN